VDRPGGLVKLPAAIVWVAVIALIAYVFYLHSGGH
jgi:hypothetical protein